MGELSNYAEFCERIKRNLYKVLIIGDASVGKTSIVNQICEHKFSPNYRVTMGVDFVNKLLELPSGESLRMQLWDVAGQERLTNMTRTYYRDAFAAFVVYDITRAETFESVLKWKDDLDQKVLFPDGTAVPCYVLANKCDEPEKTGLVTTPDKFDAWCKEHGFLGWFETSAKENIGIDQAFQKMAEQILIKKKSLTYIDRDVLEKSEVVQLGNYRERSPPMLPGCLFCRS